MRSLTTYSAEALEADGSSNEGLAVVHSKLFKEDGTVTVRVDLEFHGDGNIFPVDDAFHGLVRDHALAVLLEDGRVS